MRPLYDEYFMQIAHVASAMGTCSRRKVGAIAVRDRRILATGFNGSPSKTHHCDHDKYMDPCPPRLVQLGFDDGTVERDPDLIEVNGRPSCSNAIHAEANVVAFAAAYGLALRGSTIYTNTYPCHNCTKQLVSCGVVEIVFDSDYNNDPIVEQLCKEAGMVLRRYAGRKLESLL